GDFAEAYVIAHEVGHHVQNLTGQMERVRSRQGADSDAVRLELQADCLAGMWAGHLTETADPSAIITEVTEDDIARAIDAAETVGDDYIQSRTQGTVTPETWTQNHILNLQKHN
ncbi:MAG TPA: neutral zinc metallopeptidase, partial [Bacteroidia bacterium]|nr:neutral zinc metallopeptidase [Bacteroidia bacterium]